MSDDEQSAGIKERFAPELIDIFPTAPASSDHRSADRAGPVARSDRPVSKGRQLRRKRSIPREELGRRAALAMDNARLHDLVRAGIHARDDMIGIVSHDLRNPVNAVRMLTGVMLDSERTGTLPPRWSITLG